MKKAHLKRVMDFLHKMREDNKDVNQGIFHIKNLLSGNVKSNFKRMNDINDYDREVVFRMGKAPKKWEYFAYLEARKLCFLLLFASWRLIFSH